MEYNIRLTVEWDLILHSENKIFLKKFHIFWHKSSFNIFSFYYIIQNIMIEHFSHYSFPSGVCVIKCF